MDVRTYRAFSGELMKIASDVQDADIRALLADRRGEEYLRGGELDSEIVRAQDTQDNLRGMHKKSSRLFLASDSYNLRARKKKPGKYQEARDYAATGLKGALTGAGIVELGRKLGVGGAPMVKHYRAAAGIGAAATLADRAYRHVHGEPVQKQAGAVESLSQGFRSPAVSLHRAQQTGKTLNILHKGSAGKPAGLMGKNFRLPAG